MQLMTSIEVKSHHLLRLTCLLSQLAPTGLFRHGVVEAPYNTSPKRKMQMRTLKIDELTHVYGAGGKGKSCSTDKGKGGTGSKGHGSKNKSHGSKHRSGGSKGHCR